MILGKSDDSYLARSFWITKEAFIPLVLASEACFRNA
jgi:hypothetical protein